MQIKKCILFLVFIFCAISTFSQGKSSAADKARANLDARRTRALEALAKAERAYREADSLRTSGRRGDKDADFAEEEIYRKQAALEKRVFDEQLPEIEKLEQSEDFKVQKQALERKNQLRAQYNTELKQLQAEHAELMRKWGQSDKEIMRGQEKIRIAKEALHEAKKTLSSIDNELELINRREAMQKAQKEKELLERQQAKDQAQLAKEKGKAKMQADREKQAQLREADKAKLQQVKDKQVVQKNKEKEKQQAIQAKEKEKRDAEKAKMQAEREKQAALKAKEKEKREAERAIILQQREAEKAEREKAAAEKARLQAEKAKKQTEKNAEKK
ncbi:MAG: hypothetical protein ACRCSB_02175 [Bacteroidales bacterium]